METDYFMLHLGFNNYVVANKIMAIAGYNTAPTKRLVKICKERGMCIDATEGRKTKTVIMLQDGYLALSFFDRNTLAKRYNDGIIEKMRGDKK